MTFLWHCEVKLGRDQCTKSAFVQRPPEPQEGVRNGCQKYDHVVFASNLHIVNRLVLGRHFTTFLSSTLSPLAVDPLADLQRSLYYAYELQTRPEKYRRPDEKERKFVARFHTCDADGRGRGRINLQSNNSEVEQIILWPFHGWWIAWSSWPEHGLYALNTTMTRSGEYSQLRSEWTENCTLQAWPTRWRRTTWKGALRDWSP